MPLVPYQRSAPAAAVMHRRSALSCVAWALMLGLGLGALCTWRSTDPRTLVVQPTHNRVARPIPVALGAAPRGRVQPRVQLWSPPLHVAAAAQWVPQGSSIGTLRPRTSVGQGMYALVGVACAVALALCGWARWHLEATCGGLRGTCKWRMVGMGMDPAPAAIARDTEGGMQLRLVLETPECIVVHKPPGLSFHDEGEGVEHAGVPGHVGGIGSSGDARPGITPGVMTQLHALQSAGRLGGPSLSVRPRLFPVHRLDKETSGLLLVAKGVEAARAFVRAFREHRVQKYYCALTARKPSKKMGRVVGDMVKGRRGSWKLLPQRNSQNPAVTAFVARGLGYTGEKVALADGCNRSVAVSETLQSAGTAKAVAGSKFGFSVHLNLSSRSASSNTYDSSPAPCQREATKPAPTSGPSPDLSHSFARPPLRFVVLKPTTGRTHQLRVALKSLGAPVLGDVRYANAQEALKEDRMYLHACVLRVPALQLGGGRKSQAVQVVSEPGPGTAFLDVQCHARFLEFFSEGCEHDLGDWTVGPHSMQKLLGSETIV